MWAFVSHHLGGDEELHSRLEQVEIISLLPEKRLRMEPRL